MLTKDKIQKEVDLQIVPFETKYAAAFRELNVEWISTYFKMESSDYKVLDNPVSEIINKGGFIFVALIDQEPAGVCALLKLNGHDYDYELAKMAVSPRMQGKKVGLLLGQIIIQKVKDLGGKHLFLESNTLLKPAIRLYTKLGFKEVDGYSSPYERANIQMALVFD